MKNLQKIQNLLVFKQINRTLFSTNFSQQEQNIYINKIKQFLQPQKCLHSKYTLSPLTFKLAFNFSKSSQQGQNKSSASFSSQNDQELFSNMNYYQILGFQNNINPTQEQIKVAYLDAVKKYHPDLSTDKLAAQKFQYIQKIYQTLSDPQKRSDYRSSLKIPVKQEKIYQTAKKFKQQFKNYDKIMKQRVPDQWQFSYKLYKQHYQKVQVPKKQYKKYHGQDEQYWVHKDQIPVSDKFIFKLISMVTGSVLIGSCAFYYVWK